LRGGDGPQVRHDILPGRRIIEAYTALNALGRSAMDTDPAPDPSNRVAVDNVPLVEKGQPQSKVIEHLGQPAWVVTPEQVKGPTETMQEFGFTVFDFEADRDIEVVWIYAHDRRGKFKLTSPLFTYISFRKGLVAGAWKESHAPGSPPAA
jgi:hypothetical protein